MVNEAMRRISVEGYSESSSSESYQHLSAPSISISSDNHRSIDVNSAKNPAVHRDSNLFNPFTVLRSCPLWDTIAILIVLLQIPSTILTLVHLLFALLTFVPPSASGHQFNIQEILEGAVGTPSLMTILAVDLVVGIVWLFLWSPLQDVSLDVAQSVIALTLGGGTSGKDAGYWNVAACLGTIGLSHMIKKGGFKSAPGIRLLLPMTGATDLLTPDRDDSTDIASSTTNWGIGGAVRALLAIHILTQGLVRYIRDWYVRREKRDTSSIGHGDPEAANGHTHKVDGLSVDSSLHNTPGAVTPDHDHTAFPGGLDKGLTAKKKRKVSALVRLRQPLWSALASTKIVMAKEYETSRSASESAGANATDVNNLGNAPFSTEAERVWITYVGSDEVCFNTSHFPRHSGKDGNANTSTPGIDKSKPFYIRINSSIWAPSKIYPIEDEESVKSNEVHWAGEIFGLAGMSNYECEFISTIDNSVIFSTNVKTRQAPHDTSSAAPMLSPNVQQSPTTTLRTSIAALEASRDEELNKQRRFRKDQKSKANAVRREIEKLSNSMATAGGNDDKLRQKIQQSNLHAKQADESVITLTAELEQLETLPEEEARHFKQAKAAWQSHKDMHKASRKDYEEFTQESKRKIAELNAEVAAFQQEKEKMQKRINNQKEKYERITDANARGLDEAQRKETERVAREQERIRTEASYNERISSLTMQTSQMQAEMNSVWENISHLQAMNMQAYNAQYAHNPYDANEPHHQQQQQPSSANNNSYNWNPTANFNPNMSYDHYYSAPMSSNTAHNAQRTRGRSSSMLSNVSGFTLSSTEEMPALPQDVAELIERETEGVESTGSSGSASTGDPKSPVPGYRSGTIIGGSRYVNPWDNA